MISPPLELIKIIVYNFSKVLFRDGSWLLNTEIILEKKENIISKFLASQFVLLFHIYVFNYDIRDE